MFEIGSWVIDTKRREVVTVEKVLNDYLYIVSNDDDECYIVKECTLIKYDKHWFNDN